MKFGKEILANQVPGWSAAYLDYKGLKKIVSSLTKKRITTNNSVSPALEADPTSLPAAEGVRGFAGGVVRPLGQPALWEAASREPAEPPLPAILQSSDERGPAFQEHKTAFFSKLERELEKINTFYLQKEAELRLRLESLLSKRQAAAQRPSESAPDSTPLNYVEWRAIEEGFRLLERDLGKVQQFIDVNATGFRKILKKWDKRSKSTTKELYLSRQVEVTPCFNRQLISEMTDTVALCLLDIANPAVVSPRSFEGHGDRAAPIGSDYRELEDSFGKAIAARDEATLVALLGQAAELALQAGSRTHVARILWRSIIVAPPALADVMISSKDTSFDFGFVDDINGRTCLHEASIAGELRLVNICLARGVPVNRVDAYGRNALHYAATNGHAAICQALLDFEGPSGRIDPCATDLENYRPLVYACISGSRDCVNILLSDPQVAADIPTAARELDPLALAAQHGHVAIVQVLLAHHARNLPNRNGELPLHLAAREGHVEVCDVLLRHEVCDRADKYNEWTPLFHAAVNGHASCVNIILQAGCNCEALDENGRTALYHAAWHGHVDCVALLLTATADAKASLKPAQTSPFINISPSQVEAGSDVGDLDMIPSLLLPPPIMPLRTYGHSFLNNNHLVVVALGHPFTDISTEPLKLQPRNFVHASPAEKRAVSPALRLVVSSIPETAMTPFEIQLPVGGQPASVAFQAAAIDQLSLQFSLYPSFGSKTLGRAVVHPSSLSKMRRMTACTLPLLDHRLNVIGEISADILAISPLKGVTLAVNGGAVDTYWKSNVPQPPPPPAALPRGQRIASAHASPSYLSVGMTDSPRPSTVSSLTGDFVHAVVQVTSDGVPVVCRDRRLPDSNYTLGVPNVTIAEFNNLAQRLGKDNWKHGQSATAAAWHSVLQDKFLPLRTLCEVLPSTMGLCLELSFTTIGLNQPPPDIDSNVAAVLLALYEFSSSQSLPVSVRRRKIALFSRSPDVCAAANWKQPNYPVFFASTCGFPGVSTEGDAPSDGRCRSIAAAAEFASSNNLLGIMVPASLVVNVPALAAGVRDHGLMLATFGTTDGGASIVENVDAALSGGVFTMTDSSRRTAI